MIFLVKNGFIHLNKSVFLFFFIHTFILFVLNLTIHKMQNVLLQLPVPSYLKKILEKRYGENFQASRKTLLGLTIINTLKGKRDRDYESARKIYTNGNYRFKSTKEYYFIRVSVDTAKRKGYVHTQATAEHIVRALDRDIREDLYMTAIFNKEKYGIEYKTSILNFLDLYDISDEELSYDSLRKDFNRKRLKIEQKLKINA